MREIIEEMGGQMEFDPTQATVTINASQLKNLTAEQMVRYNKISRIPILLCAPLLHKFRKVYLPTLGGCNLGERPVDFHINALQQMGAELSVTPHGSLLEARNGLTGARIQLPYPSVGATEQVLLSACLAKGETELMGAAVEPEIIDLICQLQKMGALISLESDRTLRIQGVAHLNGCSHRGMPDRIEAGSWACAALATNGRIRVLGARQVDMLAFLNTFSLAGGGFEADEFGITFYRQASEVHPILLQTGVHPGFMTDWQQPLVTALTQAKGISLVHETVYESRFGFVEQLNKMGANIKISQDCIGSRCRFGRLNHSHSAIIAGPTTLIGQTMEVPDLRAGFSYVIAALVAKGTSHIQRIELIKRGYDQFSEKLQALGANFEFIHEA
ncbi:MAG: UDP-N-acetylglucosamine 1-carboxyvinyltransferase, partial [Gammaproteobacteria bacterium]|nr:UDP-N-acetylglucosamine 1-carboxyvinyltransferase [Gammaproteobacteria bacterium]